MPLLRKEELENIRTYTYIMEGDDVLDPYFMMFWNRLIDYFPWRWSPNTITLVGLLLNISYMAVLFAISPDGKAEVGFFSTVTELIDNYTDILTPSNKPFKTARLLQTLQFRVK